MNEDVIADLKQFIATTVTQQTTHLEDKVDRLDLKIDAVGSKLSAKIDAVDQKLSAKIDDLQEFVSDALTTSNDSADTQLKDHELRLIKLEQKAA